MSDPSRVLDLGRAQNDPLACEWLVTNGLGGYASGTVAGVPTRRYHGLLIAALPNPLGRIMMLNQLSDEVVLPSGQVRALGWTEPRAPSDQMPLVDFRLELGLPVWRYAGHDVVIERRIVMLHDRNVTLVGYRLIEGEPVTLRQRVSLHFRGHDTAVADEQAPVYALVSHGDQLTVIAPEPFPRLQLHVRGERAQFNAARVERDATYPTEASRGYSARSMLDSPGYFSVELTRHRDACLIASTEAADVVMAIDVVAATEAERTRRRQLIAAAPAPLQTGPAAELVLAADQFIIRPVGRIQDPNARADGNQSFSVIAGYHWFTDWGRDTMISLEGLTLLTGRHAEAGAILRTFAAHIKNGLVPNMFPEGESLGLYHTADATLWFVHALDRYVTLSGDRATLTQLLPQLYDIVDHHLAGTSFGIGVDASDGLLRQGAPGYQLTWMDAKVGDWVVTPRRGKAVEINALWYNALCVIAEWAKLHHDDDRYQALTTHAAQARASFNRRFWNPATQYLFDVVDGETGSDDPSCRPNQIFAVSLRHPVLAEEHWRAVVDVVEKQLLTPVGLRSLSPDHPDFKPTYFGDLMTRDAAYHQGTVWSWLIGPYVDASLRVWPDRRAAIQRTIAGLIAELDDACVGTISEVFDAEPPFTPRGCIAQAWGVAELLRSLAALS